MIIAYFKFTHIPTRYSRVPVANAATGCYSGYVEA